MPEKIINGRKFTLRKSGQYHTNMRPLLIFSEEEWEELQKLARLEGTSPTQYVEHYCANICWKIQADIKYHRENGDWKDENDTL